MEWHLGRLVCNSVSQSFRIRASLISCKVQATLQDPRQFEITNSMFDCNVLTSIRDVSFVKTLNYRDYCVPVVIDSSTYAINMKISLSVLLSRLNASIDRSKFGTRIV